jgi:BMFP domain-containing protein YqiC
MVFESVRGYVQLASGLSELTRARATEAAHGLLSLQGSGIETGSKLAVQVSALAEELLAAATANRHNLTTLVRTEVDAAVSRIGLVPAEQLEASQSELAELRAELAALRASLSKGTATKKTAAKKAAVKKSTVKKTAASKAAVKKSAVKRSAAKKTSAVSAASGPVTMSTSTGRSAVTTRRKPAGA